MSSTSSRPSSPPPPHPSLLTTAHEASSHVLPPAYAPPPIYSLDPSQAHRDFHDSDDEELPPSLVPYTSHQDLAAYRIPSPELKSAFLRSMRAAIPNHPNVRIYKKGMTPLHWAVFTGDLPAVQSLLTLSESPNKIQTSSPINIIRGGATRAVDVTGDRVSKFRALHVAALFDRAAILKLLLRHGASLNAGDRHGWTPLHYAALVGSLSTAITLLDSGADLTPVSGGMRSTPLHWAADAGHIDMTRLLLERGSTVDAVDDWKWMPLHIACQKGRVEVVRILLAAGANMEARTKTGGRGVDVAKAFGWDDVVQVLETRGVAAAAG